MKSLISVLFLGVVAALHAEDVIDPLAKGDLSDWIASEHWSMEDGVVIGKTSDDDPLPFNRFLVWKGGELEDFELTCELKIVGDNNSGIQYRSKFLPEFGDDVLTGYQCDIHANPDYTAMIYEEKGRGIFATRGQKVVISPEGKKLKVGEVGGPGVIDVYDWNTYTIRAEGNRIIHKANDIITAEVIDLDEEGRSLKGVLGFQIHRGKPMEVHIKSIRIKTLPKGKILTADDVDIPADAEVVNTPKPKPAKKKKAETAQ